MKFGKLYDEIIKEIKEYQAYEDGSKLDELFNSEVVLDVWDDKIEDIISVKVNDVIGLVDGGKFIIIGRVDNEN